MKQYLFFLFVLFIGFSVNAQSQPQKSDLLKKDIVITDSLTGATIIKYANPVRVNQELDVFIGNDKTKRIKAYRLIKQIEISFPKSAAPLGVMREIEVEYYTADGVKIPLEQIKFSMIS